MHQLTQIPRSVRQGVLVALAVALVAIAGVACSARSSTDSANLSSTHAGVPADSLHDAVSKTTQSDSVHLTMKMSLQAGGIGAQQVTGDGAIDFKDEAAKADLQVMGMDMQMLTVGGSVYIKAAILGDSWYKLDSKAGGAGGIGSVFANGFLDPAQQFAMLKDSATDVTKVGTEQVNGESTTHYKATIDVAKAAEKEGLDGEHLDELNGIGASTIPVDVWVDGDGRVARMAISYTGGSDAQGPLAGAEIDVTVDYSDYGKPVDIEAPPADQVKDFSESGFGAILGGGMTQ